MKSSVETKVGMAVASVFVGVTMCVMAQGHSGGGTGGPQGYGPTNNPGLDHMSTQGYNSSLPGRTNAEENRTKFSNATEETTTTKGKKKKSLKSTKHRSGRAETNQSTRVNESGD
jgi:hypothetical protein